MNNGKTPQENVLAALRSMVSKRRPWLPLSILRNYDGRTVGALARRRLIEVNLEYGVRPVPAKPDTARHYEPVSKTDEACIHCRSAFMSHSNGRCPQ